jgi:hypothetical protein
LERISEELEEWRSERSRSSSRLGSSVSSNGSHHAPSVVSSHTTHQWARRATLLCSHLPRNVEKVIRPPGQSSVGVQLLPSNSARDHHSTATTSAPQTVHTHLFFLFSSHLILMSSKFQVPQLLIASTTASLFKLLELLQFKQYHDHSQLDYRPTRNSHSRTKARCTHDDQARGLSVSSHWLVCVTRADQRP